LKQLTKISGLALFLAFLSFTKLQAQTPCDSLKVLELYSLFSEYHKNKDCKSAVPYGWQVLNCTKEKFAKWIYYKMEECLWMLHDSSDISEEEITAIEDTITAFYDMAIQYYPSAKGYFTARKAFVSETWLGTDPQQLMTMYENAIAADSNISTYYYDKLGEIYYARMEEDPDSKLKGLELYGYLSNKEPENAVWVAKQERFVENLSELVDLAKKQWDLDPQNPEKAWKYASAAIKSNMYQDAIPALEFLVSNNPQSVSYLNQLASAYQKTEQFDKAENAFKKLIELEPDKKEHYLNLGILAKDKGQLSQARNYYQKASEVGGGWGLPIYYEGNLYEQAARECGFEFEDKVVYQLAADTYRRAFNMDPSVTQARDRVSALSGSVPSKEDYFFRGYKSGDVIPVKGNCYGWIGKSVTVP
jgi:tetratricopeptide (TPR) repeat protein